MSHSSISAPVALVTGGARRIGAVIVETLHRAGFRVVIHYHQSQRPAQDLADRLNQTRENSAKTVQADLNHFARLKELILESIHHWGRLDVLVNNASSFYPTPVGKTTQEQWQDLINTNLKAPYFLAQASAESLAAAQGCIINVADIHGERPLKGYSVYSIAKSGLIMLTQSLALELAPKIRVNSVAPGVTLFPEKTWSEDFINTLKEKTLLKRFSQPMDIAEAILFFIRQPAITGQVLNIDAGRSLRQ